MKENENPCGLHEAAWQGNIEEIQRLINLGIDCNLAHREHGTFPVDFVAQKGQLEALKLLMLFKAKTLS